MVQDLLPVTDDVYSWESEDGGKREVQKYGFSKIFGSFSHSLDIFRSCSLSLPSLLFTLLVRSFFHPFHIFLLCSFLGVGHDWWAGI